MDAKDRERSQSRRPSIKRPWEEDSVLPERGYAWLGTSLPPIGPPPHRRPSVPTLPRHDDVGPDGGNLHSLYHPVNRESGPKRVRYEGSDDYLSAADLKLQSRAPRKSSRPSAMITGSGCLTNPQRYIIRPRDPWTRQNSRKGGRLGNPLKTQLSFVQDAGG